MCSFRFRSRTKAKLQISQAYDRIPLWVAMCSVKMFCKDEKSKKLNRWWCYQKWVAYKEPKALATNIAAVLLHFRVDIFVHIQPLLGREAQITVRTVEFQNVQRLVLVILRTIFCYIVATFMGTFYRFFDFYIFVFVWWFLLARFLQFQPVNRR